LGWRADAGWRVRPRCVSRGGFPAGGRRSAVCWVRIGPRGARDRGLPPLKWCAALGPATTAVKGEGVFSVVGRGGEGAHTAFSGISRGDYREVCLARSPREPLKSEFRGSLRDVIAGPNSPGEWDTFRACQKSLKELFGRIR